MHKQDENIQHAKHTTFTNMYEQISCMWKLFTSYLSSWPRVLNVDIDARHVAVACIRLKTGNMTDRSPQCIHILVCWPRANTPRDTGCAPPTSNHWRSIEYIDKLSACSRYSSSTIHLVETHKKNRLHWDTWIVRSKPINLVSHLRLFLSFCVFPISLPLCGPPSTVWLMLLFIIHNDCHCQSRKCNASHWLLICSVMQHTHTRWFRWVDGMVSLWATGGRQPTLIRQ